MIESLIWLILLTAILFLKLLSKPSGDSNSYFSPREASTLAIVLATIAGAFVLALADNIELDMINRTTIVLFIAGIGIVYRENTIWRESIEGNLRKDPNSKIKKNRFINSLFLRFFQYSPLLYLFGIKYTPFIGREYILSLIVFVVIIFTINEHVRWYKDPEPNNSCAIIERSSRIAPLR